MELLKKASEPVIPRKQLLDNSNGCELEEFRKRKTVVQVVRDFPPDCGIKEAERKPLKNLKNVQSNLGMMTSYGNDKLLDTQPVENNKPSSFRPKEFGGNKSCFGSRPTGKVQFWDPMCSNLGKLTSNGEDKLVDSQPLEHNKLKSIKPTELGRNRPFGSKPAGKVKFWDPTCIRESYGQKPKVTQNKPLKNSDIDPNRRNMSSNREDKLVNSQPVEDNKIKRFESKELGRNKSYFGSKSTGKVKYWDPTCLKEGDAPKSAGTTTIVSRKEHIKREKIKEAMTIFDQVYEKLYHDNRLKPIGEKIGHWRVTVEAAKIVKQRLKWMEPEKIIGPICGVEIGDKFKYRSQLQMIGLHCQPQSGIDYTNIDGKNLAISIVDSHRYSNESGSSDMLIYCGHGGLGFSGRKLPPEDQKLERGNLALKNSIGAKTPVRVIRKVEGFGKNEVFVYDGLYIVNHYTQKRSAEGKIVFNFQLNRVSGQPPGHRTVQC